jgi:hypothetical protein
LAAMWMALQAARRQLALATLVLAGWAALQAMIACSGFYAGPVSVPPRFVLAIAPPFLLLVVLVFSPGGRTWLGSLDASTLVLLHAVRIPVEIVLHRLYLEGSIPQVMTWEGRNLDILTGISALFLFVWMRRADAPPRNLLLAWNILGLALVLSVLIHGVLSAPSSFQRFSAQDGSFALLHAPFVWLPGLIVPLVVLAHTASLVQLLGGLAAQSASSRP